jgi:hypothetical protein
VRVAYKCIQWCIDISNIILEFGPSTTTECTTELAESSSLPLHFAILVVLNTIKKHAGKTDLVQYLCFVRHAIALRSSNAHHDTRPFLLDLFGNLTDW